MNRGLTGARGINQALQEALNPPGEGSVDKFGYRFSVGDKVMQIENNYDRDVYNGGGQRDAGGAALAEAEGADSGVGSGEECPVGAADGGQQRKLKKKWICQGKDNQGKYHAEIDRNLGRSIGMPAHLSDHLMANHIS